MNVEQTVVVGMLWITALTSLGIAVFAWRRRHMGNWAMPFTILALAVVIWSTAYATEVASATQAAKVFWAKVEYLGIVTVPVAWFVFALQYTGHTDWLTRRRLLALGISPAFTLLFVSTNERHGLNWSRIGMDMSGPFPVLDTTHGFWFWIHTAYSYLLIVAGAVLLVQAYLRYAGPYRRQNASLVAGATLPLIANLIFVLELVPVPMDVTMLAFTMSCLLMANAIFRYRLFDIVPVARRTAVDNMRDGMIVVDARSRVVDINPAALALFQRSTNEMIGQPLGEFLQTQPALVNSFRDVSDIRTEITVTIGNQPQHFELHISPLHDAQERLYGRLIVFYDITIRKRAEQELARARDEALETSRFKSELLARVSHELRTPLNVILGYTEMLQEGIFGPLTELQWEPTEKILQSTDFLTRQVGELLDLAKLEVGQLSLNRQEFAIADVVKSIHEHISVLARNKKVQLVKEIQDNVPPVLYGDPDRIEQILLNLVGNGVKFSDEGVVTLRVFLPDDSHVALQVTDQGIGIPPEMVAVIFEPFKQVDGSITRMYPGTGLGLAIVKQLTDLMDGTIEVQSQEGEGSTFTVYLPLVAAAERGT